MNSRWRTQADPIPTYGVHLFAGSIEARRQALPDRGALPWPPAAERAEQDDLMEDDPGVGGGRHSPRISERA